MVASQAKFNQFPYAGNFDSTKHPALIDPNDVVDMNNLIFTTYSTKKLRPGISPVFTQSVPAESREIVSYADFWRLGTQRFVYCNGVDVVAVETDGTSYVITPNGVTLNDANVFFLVFQGLLIVFFGNTDYRPHYWTGTGAMVELTDYPEGTPFGRIWLNAVWVPDPSVPGRLKKSKTGDPTDLTSGDALDFDLDVSDGDPDGITAIFDPVFDALYVSKRFSIHKIYIQLDNLTGDFVYGRNVVSKGIGCISHQAAVAVEDVIIFPSDRGVHILSQTDKVSGVETQFLSKNIQPLWVKEINFARRQWMRAVYDNSRNCYLLLFPDKGRNYNSSCWGYSLYANSWFRWQDYNQTCIFRYIDPVEEDIKIGVCSGDGQIGFIDDDVKTDFGVRYRASIQSGIISFSGVPKDCFQLSQLSAFFVPQASGKMTITYRIDGVVIDTLEFDLKSVEIGDNLGEDFTTGISILGNYPEIGGETVNTKGDGHFFNFLIEYIPSVVSEPEDGFEILGLVMGLVPVTSRLGKFGG